MRKNRFLPKFAVMSFLIISVIGLSIADHKDYDNDKAKLTGTVEPTGISATVNVIDNNNNGEFNLYNNPEGVQPEGHPEAEEHIVASAEVDPQTGMFEIEGLEAGTYKLEIEPHDEGYEKKELEEVTLEAGEEKDLGAIALDEKESYDDEIEWE
jgi:uncharacterized membrane protein